MNNKKLITELEKIQDELESKQSTVHLHAQLQNLIEFFNFHKNRVLIDLELAFKLLEFPDNELIVNYLKRVCEENGHDIEILEGFQFCKICKWTQKPYDSMNGAIPT
jgi:hypothetical protein